jgi:hypothetical protein
MRKNSFRTYLRRKGVTTARSSQAAFTVTERQLEAIIRKIVRQVVREEFQRALQEYPERVEKWMADPQSPLYKDMVEIRREVRKGKVHLQGDSEAWGA